MDLADDTAWTHYNSALATYSFVMIGVECKTLSRAGQNPGGPRPLRSKALPAGLPSHTLTQSEKDDLNTANYFITQCVRLAWRCLSLDIGFAIENPEPWDPEAPSLWDLNNVAELCADTRVSIVDFDQCMWGSDSRKPTRIAYFKVDLSSLSRRCNHKPHWLNVTNYKGHTKKVWGPHPPLIRQKQDGQFATKAAAAYPAHLNIQLAEQIYRSVPF